MADAMSDNVKTVAHFISQVEQEIAEAKSGATPVDIARVVVRARQTQLNAVALNLQFQRMHRGKIVGDLPMNTSAKEPPKVSGNTE